MLDAFLDAFHGVNRLLGTIEGELVKRTAELVLLLLVSYMIISEWRRERDDQLRYLMYGFATLALQKLLLAGVIALVVFGGLDVKVFTTYLPVVYRFMEIFSLALIANAFVFPVRKDKKAYLARVRWALLGILGLFFAAQVLWTSWLSLYPAASVLRHVFFILLECMELAIFSYAILMLWRHGKMDKYTVNVMVACAVFLVTPLINIANHVLFFAESSHLRVLAHPFPIISVLLFTRVVYLRLVDKATLKSELTRTQRKYEESKEMGKMKDEFVSVVSHELRTPLTSMRLYNSLMLEGKMGPLTKEQEDTLRIMASENSRLASLINDILSLSKLESRKVRLERKRCDLSRLVDYGAYKALAEQKGISVVNNVPGLQVDVDPDKFKQVFINLFSNAVKYTESGGQVFLDARKGRGWWEFSVRDTGIGIRKEDAGRIFDKFYQVEDYMTRKEGGTGLGLPIVKRIVELHGGSIDVTSSPGKGSTFTVRMPA